MMKAVFLEKPMLLGKLQERKKISLLMFRLFVNVTICLKVLFIKVCVLYLKSELFASFNIQKIFVFALYSVNNLILKILVCSILCFQI